MQTVAITFFSIAAILSVVLMPNNLALMPLLVVSAARAVALALAMLFWTAGGRVDSWGSSRLGLSLMTVAAVVLLSAGCFYIQMLRDDELPAPMPVVYRVVAALLLICFLAGALLPSRKLFLIATVLAPLAGIVAYSTWKPLNARYIANSPAGKRQREHDKLLVRRMSDLARIPETEDVTPLLAFVHPGELYEVRREAQERVQQIPDWPEQLSAMLERANRLNALYALTRLTQRLPDPMIDRCWSAAASIARDGMDRLKKGSVPTESDEQMLLESVDALGSHSEPIRERHVKDMVAVRDFLVAAKAPVNTSLLGSWVRLSQFHAIAEGAGIEPLLEFTAPSEVWDLRQAALARIPNTPQTNAHLVSLLDGPHRLDALVVLAERADGLTEEGRERCWKAARLTAKEMARGVEQGKPPTGTEVRKLYSSVGTFWTKSGSSPDERLAVVAMVRDVVRAAGDDVDKAAFQWADRALASPAQAPPAGSGK